MRNKNAERNRGNKFVLFLAFTFFSLLLISFASASSFETAALPPQQQGSSVILTQDCNCTYANVTSVVLANKTIMVLNAPMTSTGQFFNYTLSGEYTQSLGTYSVHGIGDLDGQNQPFSYTFSVTSSGASGMPLGLDIILIVIAYGIGGFGFVKRNPYIAAIGGFALGVLGIFFFNSGIDIYKNWITDAFSYFTAAIGLILIGMSVEAWLDW